MNSWKAINLNKQYGQQRVIFLSILTMLFSFIFIYVPVNYIFVPTSLNDKYFILLLIGLWLMYPLHKIIHLLPIIPFNKNIQKKITMKYFIFPIINIRIVDPISKWFFIFSLIMPFMVINALLIMSCYTFNNYVHYFTILIAFHIGICVSDFICIKKVLFAPNHAYIEENEDGFEILVTHSYK
jgi:hypothetical protein